MINVYQNTERNLIYITNILILLTRTSVLNSEHTKFIRDGNNIENLDVKILKTI